jgi:hypothetical protein
MSCPLSQKYVWEFMPYVGMASCLHYFPRMCMVNIAKNVSKERAERVKTFLSISMLGKNTLDFTGFI